MFWVCVIVYCVTGGARLYTVLRGVSVFWVCVCVIVYCVLREVPVFWVCVCVCDCILCVTGGACVLGV